ncbi:MAG: hypothetical protein ACE5EM_11900 [Sphingomonadales bacterium]
MHASIRFLTAAVVAFAALPAAAGCLRPAEPTLVDGNVATQGEMVAMVKAIKKYQAELAEFRTCLDAEQQNADGEISEEIRIISLQRYNASVDAEASLITQFNAAIRAYKDRNPQ